jgi:hypothetical protein
MDGNHEKYSCHVRVVADTASDSSGTDINKEIRLAANDKINSWLEAIGSGSELKKRRAKGYIYIFLSENARERYHKKYPRLSECNLEFEFNELLDKTLALALALPVDEPAQDSDEEEESNRRKRENISEFSIKLCASIKREDTLQTSKSCLLNWFYFYGWDFESKVKKLFPKSPLSQEEIENATEDQLNIWIKSFLDGNTKKKAQARRYIEQYISIHARSLSFQKENSAKPCWYGLNFRKIVDETVEYVSKIKNAPLYRLKEQKPLEFTSSYSFRSIKHCLILCFYERCDYYHRIKKYPRKSRPPGGNPKREFEKQLGMPPLSLDVRVDETGPYTFKDFIADSGNSHLDDSELDFQLSDAERFWQLMMRSSNVVQIMRNLIEKPSLRDQLFAFQHGKFPKLNALLLTEMIIVMPEKYLFSGEGKPLMSLARKDIVEERLAKDVGVTRDVLRTWILKYFGFLKDFLMKLHEQGEFGDE